MIVALLAEIATKLIPAFCILKKRKKSPTKILNCQTEVQRVATSTCGHTGAGNSNGILPILPVQVKCNKGNKVIETYVFLDPGSTGTFCSENMVERLNTEG